MFKFIAGFAFCFALVTLGISEQMKTGQVVFYKR